MTHTLHHSRGDLNPSEGPAPERSGRARQVQPERRPSPGRDSTRQAAAVPARPDRRRSPGPDRSRREPQRPRGPGRTARRSGRGPAAAMPGPGPRPRRPPGRRRPASGPGPAHALRHSAARCRRDSRRSAGSPPRRPRRRGPAASVSDDRLGPAARGRIASATSAATTDRSSRSGRGSSRPCSLRASRSRSFVSPRQPLRWPRRSSARAARSPVRVALGAASADSAVERIAASGVRISCEASRDEPALSFVGLPGSVAASDRPGSRRRRRRATMTAPSATTSARAIRWIDRS